MPESTTSARRIEVAERRRKLLELRKAGMTYQRIVELHPELGYKTRSAAAQDAKRALRDVLDEAARDVLALELSRLDGLLEPVWVQARKGNLGAVDRALRIMDRRARFLGLDYADRNVEASDAADQRGVVGDMADAIREAAHLLSDDEGSGDHLADAEAAPESDADTELRGS